ncbi:serine/threonine protein kinase [Marinicella litoralis]|uniref:Serine/threonine protein kinase n=1 Tax=Marinicella litoralis TaxID=644220 RepID=A0A4R6XRD5_9GAMM|nr:serine/threonine-protein kinase [Marinicella litoralis]TDR20554.1 serine/threonine protein kinase [Marinicella litoralis]
MTPERFKQIKTILANTLDQPLPDQPAYLQMACGEDQDLLSEVKSLLATEMNENFLHILPIATTTEDEVIPKQIGRIKIQRLLASGGMGHVYVGLDELLKRKVAVKVMNSDLHLSTEQRAILLNEAQVLSSLQHPNICQIHDFFTEQNNDILVLEYLDGCTLSKAITDQSIAQPLLVAQSILMALTTAHERGIAHRDLKPDNIMITEQGEVKILDFGLAKIQPISHSATDVPLHEEMDVQASVEQTQIAGTPGYMSPEQAQGVRATTATDIWSFGLILIELLSGTKPYPQHATTKDLLKRASEASVQIPETFSKDKKQLITQLLDPVPANRPSARMTLEVINRMIDKPKRRLKTLAVTLVALLVVLSGWKYTADLSHERNMAIQATNRAVEARNQAESLVDYMLNDLYTGLRAVGRTELLQSTANKALQYYDNLSDEQIKLKKGMPAIALIQIAEVFGDKGDQAQALSTLSTAITKLQRLYQSQPDDELIMYRMADSYIKAANILKIAGELELTKQYAYKATQIGQQLTADLTPGKGPTTTPDGTDRWRILLRSIYLNADGHMRLGERTQAIKLLEQGLVDAMPAARNNAKLKVNLADIQFKLCNTFYDANLTEKLLAPCLATFAMDREMYESNPKDFQVLQYFVGDHGVIANVYRKLNRLDESLAYAKAGIALGEQLIQLDPENEGALNEYVTVILALGRAQKQLGLIQESQQTFTKALNVIGPIAADQEEISYMNSHFTALVMLGKTAQAKAVAKKLSALSFMRRDYQDLCVEYNIKECRIDSLKEQPL